MSIKPIQFVIWGIRGGFQSNWMSNGPTTPFSSYLTDQRDLWSKFKNRFFSIIITPNSRLITIYDPNVLDKFDRLGGSTMAISLVIPSGNTLVGNPIHTLRHLMEYYLSKLSDSPTFGFTESMFEDEIVGIELQPQIAASSSPASVGRKGFVQFGDENSILSFFQTLDIGSYEEVLFFSDHFPDQYPEVLQRDFGSSPISAFLPSVHITLGGYLQSRYEVRLAGKKIAVSSAGELDALPGDILEITSLALGKSKTIQVETTNNQVVWLENLFPKFVDPRPVPPPLNWKKILLLIFGILILGVVGGKLYDMLTPPPPPPPPPPESPAVDTGPQLPSKDPSPETAQKWISDTILFKSINKNLAGVSKTQEGEILKWAIPDTVSIVFISKGILLQYVEGGVVAKVKNKIISYLMPKEEGKKDDKKNGADSDPYKKGTKKTNKGCSEWKKELSNTKRSIENIKDKSNPTQVEKERLEGLIKKRNDLNSKIEANNCQ